MGGGLGGLVGSMVRKVCLVTCVLLLGCMDCMDTWPYVSSGS